jgi:serine phosphatase RsbU (regulator of sigma subunit)
MTRTVLRGASRAALAPADALARSNDYLCPELPEESAVSCFYGILDPSRGALEFANAGNEVELYLRPINAQPARLQNTQPQSVQLQSVPLQAAQVQHAPLQQVAILQENVALLAGEERPLGMQLGTKYRAAEITIAPGETLLFYNQELVALRNEQGEAFGTPRLYEVASGAHEDGDHLLEAILSALRTFTGTGEEALERVVVLIVERKNTGRMA